MIRLREGSASGKGLFPAPLLSLLFLIAVLGPGGRSAFAESPAIGSSASVAHLTVSLISGSDSIQPGGKTAAGLHFVLDKGWHIYWTNAGDSGEPPTIQWKLPPGITASPMEFPTPSRLPLGPLMDFGYENEVVFPMTLGGAANAKSGAVQLPAHVAWLVCREVCIPGKADLALPLKISSVPGAPDASAQALIDKFRARLPQPLPSGAKSVFSFNSTSFTLAITGLPDADRAAYRTSGGSGPAAEFFPLDQSQIANAAPQIVHRIPGGTELLIKKDENLNAAPARLNGVLTLPGGPSYVIGAAPGITPAPESAASLASGSVGAASFLRFALLAFAGGVLLNLMPCVFPVLFLKGLSLFESSGEERKRLRGHGLVYSLGIVLSFWAVVAVLLALRAGGHHLGWGFQFQSPGFLALITLLLFFLGLSLAGMFEIGLTLTSAGGGLASRKGYTGSFFTGILAVVVATPCAAPFMGTAIGFALAQSAVIAFAVFTALGLGLAAPYVLLTLNPAWTRLLPKPGAWMEILKQATAAPIFLTVIGLTWLFVRAAGANALAALMLAFLLLAVAGWVLGRWPARRPAAAAAVAVIAFAIAVPLYVLHAFPASPSAGTETANRGAWQPYSDAALEKYRSEGRPVFVDFTAGWCLSCQVNERVVLDRDDVQRRLRDAGIVLLRADWTNNDEAISRALNRLGRSSIPTYVIYRPGEGPELLPEVLTPGIIYNALHGLPSRSPQQLSRKQDDVGPARF